MKRIRTAALCSGIVVAMMALAMTAFGETKHMRFSEPLTVGGVELKAGFYSIKWEGTGPEVQVTFKKDGDVVATAPAKLVSEKNPNGRSIEFVTNPDDSKMVKKIAFHKEALIFDLTGAEAAPQ